MSLFRLCSCDLANLDSWILDEPILLTIFGGIGNPVFFNYGSVAVGYALKVLYWIRFCLAFTDIFNTHVDLAWAQTVDMYRVYLFTLCLKCWLTQSVLHGRNGCGQYGLDKSREKLVGIFTFQVVLPDQAHDIDAGLFFDLIRSSLH